MRVTPVVAVLALSGATMAQSTVFTYQGRLKNAGALASGLHDFRFRLFDAPVGGTQIDTTVCADNILVVEGLFTASIDFGQNFSTTAPRFLEIDVRADTGLDCSVATGFVTLLTRTPLTATPLATHARSAFSLDAPDGSHPGALIVDNGGRIGVGTAAPTHSVHIAGSEPTLALQDTDGNTGQVGYVSLRDATNTERGWMGYGSAGDPDLSIVNARAGGDIVLNPFSGNVGVGTGSPTAKLDVRGEIRYGGSGQYRPAACEEPLRIIRGEVSVSGSLVLGAGFVATHDGTGLYTITFNTPFTGAPVVTANFNHVPSGSVAFAMVENSGTTSVQIKLFNTTADLVNGAFHFIAIGPR